MSDIPEIDRIIANRRSLYPANFSGEPVDDQVIHRMLENANWAPTHRLTEPWRFVVFKGTGLQTLANFQSELYRRVTTVDGTFDEKKFKNLATKPLKASHVIAIGMHRDQKESVPELEEIAAVSCAVQNMYLTASASGVGCYWGTGGITYMPGANDFFGLEERDRLMGFMYVGMPGISWPKGRRSSVEDKVRWVG